MSWYKYREMEQFHNPQSADASFLSMISYDELMASVDPDPFYSDSEKLLQSNSSAGQYGTGYENRDRYTSTQGYGSGSSQGYDEEFQRHFSKAVVNDDNTDGSATSGSNETSGTEQSSRMISLPEYEQHEQKRCFMCTICCFDLCCVQDTNFDPTTEEFSLSGKAVFCGGCRNRSSSESSSLSESSGSDCNYNEEEAGSFDESEINESVTFVESSESGEGEEPSTLKEKELNCDLGKYDEDGISLGISMFVHSTPNALNYRDPTYLFELMQKKLWELVHKRIKSHPSELSVWIYKKKEEDGSIAWAMLPIHAAVIFGCPAHVMKTMIRFYPKGVTTGDSGWRLPIHLACHACTSASTVQLLLSASPPTINAADIFGHRCITLTLESNGPEKDEILRLLDNGVRDYSNKNNNSFHTKRQQEVYLNNTQIPARHLLRSPSFLKPNFLQRPKKKEKILLKRIKSLLPRQNKPKSGRGGALTSTE